MYCIGLCKDDLDIYIYIFSEIKDDFLKIKRK